MMASPTMLFAVLTAAHAAFDTALADDQVPVFLGPPGTDEPLPSAVILGWDGASEDGRAGSFGQEYHELGPGAARDDTGSIVGVVWAQSGDASFTTLCGRVSDVLDAMQSAMRSNPRLGLDDVLRIELTSAELFLGDADGNIARLPFQLSFTALV